MDLSIPDEKAVSAAMQDILETVKKHQLLLQPLSSLPSNELLVICAFLVAAILSQSEANSEVAYNWVKYVSAHLHSVLLSEYNKIHPEDILTAVKIVLPTSETHLTNSKTVLN